MAKTLTVLEAQRATYIDFEGCCRPVAGVRPRIPVIVRPLPL
ncbi:uncharacterized protein METZ01_LOCUS249809 [marine metagenome]|uniref:Uncharacterized protein n=1 Tax=marine metagenome TaxID=408172 RepID=A0A382IC65_9ZZZZ